MKTTLGSTSRCARRHSVCAYLGGAPWDVCSRRVDEVHARAPDVAHQVHLALVGYHCIPELWIPVSGEWEAWRWASKHDNWACFVCLSVYYLRSYTLAIIFYLRRSWLGRFDPRPRLSAIMWSQQEEFPVGSISVSTPPEGG